MFEVAKPSPKHRVEIADDPLDAVAPAADRSRPHLAGCRADRVPAAPQFSYPAVDCAASQSGCPSCCADAAIALSERFIRREQPSPAFTDEFFQQLISRADVGNVDHTPRLAAGNRVAPSKIAIRFLRSCSQPNSFISPQILSRLAPRPWSRPTRRETQSIAVQGEAPAPDRFMPRPTLRPSTAAGTIDTTGPPRWGDARDEIRPAEPDPGAQTLGR